MNTAALLVFRLIIALAIGLCFILALVVAQPLIIVLALAGIAFCVAPLLFTDRRSLRNGTLDA
jgi:hypothetical protein